MTAQAASERQAFNADDFPSVSGHNDPTGVMSGRWAAAGGATGGRIAPEDFPALPGQALYTLHCCTAVPLPRHSLHSLALLRKPTASVKVARHGDSPKMYCHLQVLSVHAVA